MYGLGETAVEMTRRQILADEEMVARQRAIVQRLPPSGELAEIGRAYLAELEEGLAEHRALLARQTTPSYSSPNDLGSKTQDNSQSAASG